ncbi:MAG: PEP-CTERM sorting domain-containing protein [Cyanobacteria bacterium P01_A01_bin.137]
MIYKASALGTLAALASVFPSNQALANDDIPLSISGETTIGGITAKVTSGINPDDSAGTLGTFSEFYGEDTTTIDFNSTATQVDDNRYTFGSDVIIYTFEGAWGPALSKQTGVYNDQWAPTGANGEKNQSDYLAVFQGNSVTIDLAKEIDYFGLAWGAMSVGNNVSFQKDNAVIGTFTYDDINPIAPIKASHQKNEGNAYLHFYAADEDSTFNQIVLSQSDKGGLETDNHSFHLGASNQKTKEPESVPEPTAILGLLTAGAIMFSRKRSTV